MWDTACSIEEWFKVIFSYLDCKVSTLKIDFSTWRRGFIFNHKSQEIRDKIVEKLVCMETLEKFEFKISSKIAGQSLVYNKLRDYQQKEEVLRSVLNGDNNI